MSSPDQVGAECVTPRSDAALEQISIRETPSNSPRSKIILEFLAERVAGTASQGWLAFPGQSPPARIKNGNGTISSPFVPGTGETARFLTYSTI
jgi:hypothetical protein